MSSPKVGHHKAKKNSRAAGAPRHNGAVDPRNVHMLIVACDYKDTDFPLTSTADARHFEELARACGVSNILTLYDNQVTRFGMLKALETIGGHCTQEEDYFIFYFAGHGIQLDDNADGDIQLTNIDEVDGLDEAFVCVDENGKFSHDTVLRDDDFCVQMTLSFLPAVRILLLTDCCHSATICDMQKRIWRGYRAAHIAGCLDSETAGDIGRGGVFSHSMLLALQKLVEHEQYVCSVGKVYNAIVHEVQDTFNSAQQVTLNLPGHFEASELPWPLMPPNGYKAPLSRAINYSKINPQHHRSSSKGELNDDNLQMHNIKPSIALHAKNARAAGRAKQVKGKEYLDQIDAEDWKPQQHCRSCSSECLVQ